MRLFTSTKKNTAPMYGNHVSTPLRMTDLAMPSLASA